MGVKVTRSTKGGTCMKADVFFRESGKIPPIRNCQAAIANDELLSVHINGVKYTPEELLKLGVSAVDVYRQYETFYIHE